jgi:hypothetical protein
MVAANVDSVLVVPGAVRVEDLKSLRSVLVVLLVVVVVLTVVLVVLVVLAALVDPLGFRLLSSGRKSGA